MILKKPDTSSLKRRQQRQKFFINLAFATLSFVTLPSLADNAYSSPVEEKVNLVTLTSSAANLSLDPTSLNHGEASLEGVSNLPVRRVHTSISAEQGVKTSLSLRERGSELAISAMGLIGIPYRWGGSSQETGFDCSGLVRALYSKSVGLLLPRKAEQQAAATKAINHGDLQPGDLVFFNTMRRSFSHVGIYVGEGRFIHSPRTGATVRIDELKNSYWSKRFNGARRVPVALAQQ